VIIRTVDRMIEVHDVTKRYGSTAAVSELSFAVQPGCVTGFLGPNGSGKSTTMRLILGLDRPTSGTATVNGVGYRDLRAPLREVGALLDARGVQGGRRAGDHLLALARSNRIPRKRVGEVLGIVGLSEVADRRLSGYSLGMSQRLGIAAALLGDPPVLLFDEPINGLDTEGIRWVRGLMKRLAAEGRTVLVSSHLMSEMELTADRLLVIGGGRLLADTTLAAFVAQGATPGAVVRSADAGGLRSTLERAGALVELDATGAWHVRGMDARKIGELALAAGVAVHELTPMRSTLEDAYTEMVDGDVAYRSHAEHHEVPS
jgi:ABC-2 type transport system ATP-binding protein